MSPSRDQTLPKSRRALLGLLMAAVTLLLCLLSAEAVVRVLKRNTAFQPDPELIRSRLPSKNERVSIYETEDSLNGRSNEIPDPPLVEHRPTNNLGLRMTQDVVPKRPGEHRILIFGDSFAEGMETPFEDHPDSDVEKGSKDPARDVYQRRFDGVAERILRDRGAEWQSWTIVNAAIQNGSPSQYLLMLRRLLPAVEPDIVIVLTGSNDLADDMGFEMHYGFDLDADGLPFRPHNRLGLWLFQKSYLLRYVDVLLNRFAPRLERVLSPWRDDSMAPPITWTALSCTLQPEAVRSFERWTGRYLVELDKMVASAGASLGVVVIHYMYSFRDEAFYEPRFPWLREELARDHCYEVDAPPYVAFINGFLERHGILYRDTYPAFLAAKQNAPSQKLWNFYDYHFSPRGHELLGAEVADLLSEMRRTSASR